MAVLWVLALLLGNGTGGELCSQLLKTREDQLQHLPTGWGGEGMVQLVSWEGSVNCRCIGLLGRWTRKTRYRERGSVTDCAYTHDCVLLREKRESGPLWERHGL